MGLNTVLVKYKFLVIIAIIIFSNQIDAFFWFGKRPCVPSKTTVSGSLAPNGTICSGQLILNENFRTFNTSLWKHENTFSGGGNWEFQWYTDHPNNSFVKNEKLHIRPTLTVDTIGEDQLLHGHIKLDPCTDDQWYGCERQGTPEHIISPIRSAKLHTKESFSFKYGKMEVIAKMPAGDWLWPALWLLPTKEKYGGWPRSGEIDLAESRGNRNYTDDKGKQIGVERFESTLHFGPTRETDAYQNSTFNKQSRPGKGFDKKFHKYFLKWTPDCIKFYVDYRLVGLIPVGDGFWSRGGFEGENIWVNGTKMAPFDEEFYIILNLAVGGVNGFFPDAGNESAKPWLNSSPKAATDFWEGRKQWLSGWNLNSNNAEDASLIIDSIRVWAL